MEKITYSENPQYWWETKGGRYMEERVNEEALDYDLVFTHGVFTHIPPFQIKKALENLKQFAGRYIVLIEFELRAGQEVKNFEEIGYNEIGQYMAAGDTDTWAYDFEGLLEKDMELEKINISRNFKTSPFGHTTYIYRKKSFYEVVREIDEILNS